MPDGVLYVVAWTPGATEPPRFFGRKPGRVDAFANAGRAEALAVTLRDQGAAAVVVSVTPAELAALERDQSEPPAESRPLAELPDPRATLLHLLVRGPDLIRDDAGRPLVCQVRPVADLLALHLDHLGVQGVTVRSTPVGDLGALFHEHGLEADDLVLLEAQTTSPDDLIDWVRELAGRVARHVRDDEA